MVFILLSTRYWLGKFQICCCHCYSSNIPWKGRWWSRFLVFYQVLSLTIDKRRTLIHSPIHAESAVFYGSAVWSERVIVIFNLLGFGFFEQLVKVFWHLFAVGFGDIGGRIFGRCRWMLRRFTDVVDNLFRLSLFGTLFSKDGCIATYAMCSTTSLTRRTLSRTRIQYSKLRSWTRINTPPYLMKIMESYFTDKILRK